LFEFHPDDRYFDHDRYHVPATSIICLLSIAPAIPKTGNIKQVYFPLV